MNRASKTCDLLLDYLFGDMNDVQLSEYETHLSNCSACRSELNEVWFVQQRLLASGSYLLDEETILRRKGVVLQHAFAQRAPHLVDKPIHAHRVLKSPKFTRRKQFFTIAGVVAMVIVGVIVVSNADVSPLKQVRRVNATSVLPLKSTSLYPKAKGNAHLAQGVPQQNLVVQVTHVPLQPQRACYDIWGVSKGVFFNLGEFIVNSHGEGGVTVTLRSDLHVDHLEITLEPKWGDTVPEGPTILTSSQLPKLG